VPVNPGNDETHEWGEAIPSSDTRRPEPGDIILNPELKTAPEPLVGDDVSTPLEEDEPEGLIPPCPLWAMKEKRHVQWHLLPSHQRHDRLRDRLGTGSDALYVIDDGRQHATVGRLVGATNDGCEYCLIGRISRERYIELRDEIVPREEAFRAASDIALCGVAVEEGITSSNVFDVARYASVTEVPGEYLPGAPFIRFADDLEITAY